MAPRECTVKYCSPREGNTENQLIQYFQTLSDNTEMNYYDYYDSVLGLNLG